MFSSISTDVDDLKYYCEALLLSYNCSTYALHISTLSRLSIAALLMYQ